MKLGGVKWGPNVGALLIEIMEGTFFLAAWRKAVLIRIGSVVDAWQLEGCVWAAPHQLLG